MIRWLRKASKDWIRAAREIRELYPLERRTGSFTGHTSSLKKIRTWRMLTDPLYQPSQWFILSWMGNATWVEDLSNLLFWDVARDSVDPKKHLRWILERVLEVGNYNDWLIVKNNIPPEQMKKELGRLRVDPKARNFLERYLYGIDKISG